MDRQLIAVVERRIDQPWRQHAAQGGNQREHRFLTPFQRAHQQLALHFQTDHQEEQRHQRIVDPQQQVFINVQRAEAELHWHSQNGLVSLLRAGVIGEKHRHCRSDDQHHAAGGVIF